MHTIRVAYLPVLALVLAGCGMASTAGDRGWVALFSGKDLHGWEQINGSARYEAKDGAIVGTSVPNSPNSFLCTKKRYSDFELEFENHEGATLLVPGTNVSSLDPTKGGFRCVRECGW